MKLNRLLITLAFLMIPLPTAVAQSSSKSESLPPEKTQLIYEALLEENDESGTWPEPENSSLLSGSESATLETNAEKIAIILRQKNIEVRGNSNQLQFVHKGVQMVLLLDPEHNRLRLMTPLARLDLLRQDPDFSEVTLLQKTLKANYLATGYVRLCLNRHVLWAAFLHPLDTITERDFMNAMYQVALVARKMRGEDG